MKSKILMMQLYMDLCPGPKRSSNPSMGGDILYISDEGNCWDPKAFKTLELHTTPFHSVYVSTSGVSH